MITGLPLEHVETKLRQYECLEYTPKPLQIQGSRERFRNTINIVIATDNGPHVSRHSGHLPRKVVGILAYKPLPHKNFVASYIGFELVLGIEWALTALFL
jgi:hypothetical protein